MPAAASTHVSRRAFLRGSIRADPPAFRPPWTDDATVIAHCTGCDACVSACPETILRLQDGRPVVVLDGGECTFCGACAEACEAGVFEPDRAPPWPVAAAIGAECLLERGVSCQLCTDACPEAALAIDLSCRPVGRIRVEAAACTGCGACLAVCPASAIALQDGRIAA
jgi:ferredoxin-type protein NapF